MLLTSGRGAAPTLVKAMPEVRDIECKLAALRQEVAEARRTGYTPSQLRKLLNDCRLLWGALEQFKYAHLIDPAPTRH
jgi:predicted ATPase